MQTQRQRDREICMYIHMCIYIYMEREIVR